MGKPRPFRFAVQEHGVHDAKAWREKALLVESLGYSTLSLPDHFGDQLSPIAALMSAADATTSLRIGSLVFDNDYRHPAVLAKEAATLDLLSEGRLEFGLGAGWMASDYEQTGIPYDPPGTRIERMTEALTIIKTFFAGGRVSFAGKHYTGSKALKHCHRQCRSRARQSSSAAAAGACCGAGGGHREHQLQLERGTGQP